MNATAAAFKVSAPCNLSQGRFVLVIHIMVRTLSPIELRFNSTSYVTSLSRWVLQAPAQDLSSRAAAVRGHAVSALLQRRKLERHLISLSVQHTDRSKLCSPCTVCVCVSEIYGLW